MPVARLLHADNSFWLSLNMPEHPRVKLVHSPTPLYRLDHASRRMGIELFIKRDDLAGPSLGGNKSRQLEYYLGAALKANADTVLVTGAVQSNFVRTAAAAASSLGMEAVVQLENRVASPDSAYKASGNVLLLRILGAKIILYPDGEDETGADAALRACAEALQRRGRRSYVIPLAAENPPIGALGYIRAGREIMAQAADFDYVVVASGSGLTHIGLLVGLRLGGSKAKIFGSCVRRSATLQSARLGGVLERLCALSDSARTVDAREIHLWDGALAPGYGMMGKAAASAMGMLAHAEGILLDPVYTAKSFAAIPDLVDSGLIDKGSRVLFVHTGGLAAVFAYQADLEKVFAPPGGCKEEGSS